MQFSFAIFVLRRCVMSLPIKDRECLGQFLFSKDVTYDQFKAVSATVEVYNFIIFQSILQEVLELCLTLSNVAEPPDPLPFYLFIRIDEFVRGSVYLMLHVLFDVEFQVSLVPALNRYLI